jgi:hypothetical protein
MDCFAALAMTVVNFLQQNQIRHYERSEAIHWLTP